VKVRLQEPPYASGLLEGTLGATGAFPVLYNLIAVKTAIPANTTVVNIIPIVVNLFFIFLIYFQPNVI